MSKEFSKKETKWKIVNKLPLIRNNTLIFFTAFQIQESLQIYSHRHVGIDARKLYLMHYNLDKVVSRAIRAKPPFESPIH